MLNSISKDSHDGVRLRPRPSAAAGSDEVPSGCFWYSIVSPRELRQSGREPFEIKPDARAGRDDELPFFIWVKLYRVDCRDEGARFGCRHVEMRSWFMEVGSAPVLRCHDVMLYGLIPPPSPCSLACLPLSPQELHGECCASR